MGGSFLGGMGGGSEAWPYDFVQYVAASGNDANVGTRPGKAKLTRGAAMAAIVAAGGGEMHVGEGVAGDLWIRGDGLSVPGFYANVPFKYFGHGKTRARFGIVGASPTLTAEQVGGGDRLHPHMWLVATQFPIEINGVVQGNAFCNQIFRQWDYKRNADGTIAWANITSWVRAAGQATLTVALLPGMTITSATRVGTTVTAAYTVPAGVRTATAEGGYVRVTSTSSDFVSGDFLLLAGSGGVVGPDSGTIKYTQSGAAVTRTGIGTVQCHDIRQYDRIEVDTAAPFSAQQVPGCHYRVVGVGPDAVTITVQDLYGGTTMSVGDTPAGTRSASTTVSNPGRYVLQDRQSFVSSAYLVRGCGGGLSASQNYDRPECGPAIDLGGTADARLAFDTTSFAGYRAANGNPDDDRRCWMLVDGGASGAPSTTVRHANPDAGGIRQYGGKTATWSATLEDIHGDVEVGVAAQPAFKVVEGNTFGIVVINDVGNSDDNAGTPDVQIDSIGEGLKIDRVSKYDGPGLVNGQSGWLTRDTSMAAAGQFGFGANGLVVGDVPHLRRAGVVVTARVPNLCIDGYTNWPGAVGSLVADPYGGTRASRVTASVRIFESNADPQTGVSFTHTIGDHWVFGALVHRVGGFAGVAASILGCSLFSAGLPISGASAAYATAGDGEWMWIRGVMTSTAVPVSSPGIRLDMAVDGTLDVFMPLLQQLPVASFSANDAAEHALTVVPTPYYLAAGMCGTPERKKFIAHGGLGVGATAIVAAGTGLIATSQMAVYNERGVIIGYVDLKT